MHGLKPSPWYPGPDPYHLWNWIITWILLKYGLRNFTDEASGSIIIISSLLITAALETAEYHCEL